MTKTTRSSSTYAHSILALAAATANNASSVAADEGRERKPVRQIQKPNKPKVVQDERMQKQLTKKVRTGKVQRMIRRAVSDYDAAGRPQRDAGNQPRIRAHAVLSPGGKHWQVKEVSVP